MHRCLQYPEIIRAVAEYLDQDQALGSIAAIAQTSKAFLEPALDVLWHHITTLEHLVDCMPSDVKEIWWGTHDAVDESTTAISHLQDLRRIFSAKDWVRFDFYAKRIKTFEWGLHEGRSICNALSRHRPAMCLLPNVTSIHCSIGDPVSLASLALFLGPKLKSLYIVILPWRFSKFEIEPSSWVYSTLGALRFRCPSLEKLFIDIDPNDLVYDGETYTGLSQIICALPPLPFFSTNLSITQRAFCSLAMMPGLESVQFWVGEKGLPSSRAFLELLADEDEEELPDILFPSIQDLTVTFHDAFDVAALTELFRTMRRKRNLAEFCLVGWDKTRPPTSPPTRIRDMLLALAEAVSHDTLHTVNIETEEASYDRDAALDMAEVIQPLYPFSNLRTLRLSIAVRWSTFDNDLVDTTARWFPHLETLSFDGVREAAGIKPWRSDITFEGLRPLAELCPSLRQVQLPIDPRSWPMRASPPDSTVAEYHMPDYSRSCLDLELGGAVTADTKPVAPFIAKMFPKASSSVFRQWIHEPFSSETPSPSPSPATSPSTSPPPSPSPPP